MLEPAYSCLQIICLAIKNRTLMALIAYDLDKIFSDLQRLAFKFRLYSEV